ncbi:hypothetical protein CC2G_008365 [Coprinopsis cinerea AmutBmut pab1-1]|nr:hypothetical protein CC2G_008365 [Coprinopsis cinerea AmutBmut pab1-1]
MATLPAFSGVNRLPEEILGKVFKELFPEEATEYHRMELTSLMAVCHDWRSIILSTPQLWNNLSVSLDLCWVDGQVNPCIDPQFATRIRNWFNRAQALPLTLSLTRESMDTFPSDALSTLNGILALLLEDRHWTSFRLRLKNARDTLIQEALKSFFARLKDTRHRPWKSLRCLELPLSYTWMSSPSLWPVLNEPLQTHTPLLRCMEIHLSLPQSLQTAPTISHESLKHLRLTIPSPSVLSILTGFPKLTSLEVRLTSTRLCHFSGSSSVLRVKHPGITNLTVLDATLTSFNCLTLPNLNHLRIGSHDLFTSSLTKVEHGSALDAFLRRSECQLQSLRFDKTITLPPDQLRILLERLSRMPTLEELAFSSEDAFPDQLAYGVSNLNASQVPGPYRPLVLPALRKLTLHRQSANFNLSAFISYLEDRQCLFHSMDPKERRKPHLPPLTVELSRPFCAFEMNCWCRTRDREKFAKLKELGVQIVVGGDLWI